jgi:glutathione peroxidase
MSLHKYKATSISGKEIDLAELKGKKVMVVNTASECGLTPQYAQLQELYENTDRSKFEIIGFPCNDFGAQEPGTEDQVASFCQKNYGVTFPMTSKITVKGENTHSLYKWLLEKSAEKDQHTEVKWNFHKFLLDENGNFVKSVEPTTSPIDEEILNWIHGE